ncbi:MAG: NYN domain-containing protein [Planctomycetes bacterium]|nr:NYN domain-containing protein [Planctomycetota bacterium]
MDKYAVFIDGGYIKTVLSGFGNPDFDYFAFSESVAEDDKRLRTYYYDCAPYVSQPPSEKQKQMKARFDKFQCALKRFPRFEVRLGRLNRRRTGSETRYEQKMVDVLLTIDLVKLSVEKVIQRAVIITNDADFVPAIKVARDAGVIVKLYRGVKDHNAALMEACDEWAYIDKKLVKSLCLNKK